MTIKSLASASQGGPGFDEEDLVAAISGGDTAALGLLFDRYGTLVRRFLNRYLDGSRSELDDLVSATFMEAFRGARGFRGEASVKSWLLGIAVNVSRHWRRGEARRGAFLKLWGRRRQRGGERPDSRLEQRELGERIDVAVADLPAHLRAAFLLCEIEELSGREAAAALNIPSGTLGRHLHQARQALRKALEESL